MDDAIAKVLIFEDVKIGEIGQVAGMGEARKGNGIAEVTGHHLSQTVLGAWALE